MNIYSKFLIKNLQNTFKQKTTVVNDSTGTVINYIIS